MEIEPAQDFLLVTPHKLKNESIVIVPDTAKQDFRYFKVVATGPGTIQDGKLIEVRIQRGAIVLIVGQALDMGDGTWLCRESAVVGTVSEEDAS
jgi:co-chaperonin GroES (HSP10)